MVVGLFTLNLKPRLSTYLLMFAETRDRDKKLIKQRKKTNKNKWKIFADALSLDVRCFSVESPLACAHNEANIESRNS